MHSIDNYSAVAALVKGYARAVDLAKIVHAFAAVNLGLQCWVWFEYVRSSANIADGPSRGDFTLLNELGASRRDMIIPHPDWWDLPTTWLQYASLRA